MKIVFWSPFPNQEAKRNIQVMTDICRKQYGMQVRILRNYKKAYLRMTLKAELRWDMIFVDCQDHRGYCVERWLKDADTVVINFAQDYEAVFQYFFQHPIIRGNILYLMNTPFKNPKDNKKYLKEAYRLREEEIAVLYPRSGDCRLAVKSEQEAVKKLLKMNCFF